MSNMIYLEKYNFSFYDLIKDESVKIFTHMKEDNLALLEVLNVDNNEQLTSTLSLETIGINFLLFTP